MSWPRIARHGVRRRGQVLPLGLVFLVACCASMLFMFSAGRLVDEKLTVTNAADSAAYSAAIVEARSLNYSAYVNRAIVANELAIAQTLSLVSWLRYFETAVTNVGLFDTLASTHFVVEAVPLGLALSGTAYVDYLSGHSLADAIDLLERVNALAIINAHALAAQGLRLSQQATDLAFASGVPQLELAREVARRADPSLDVQLVPTSIAAAAGFTRTFGRDGRGGDERGRLADVVMRSRDGFTASRGFNLDGPSIPLRQRSVAFKKRGGTDLVNYDEWQAMDTLAFHAQTWPCIRKGIPRWCDPVEVPVAWGARSQTGPDGGAGGPASFGNSLAENPRTSDIARSTNEDLRNLGAVAWRGLSDTQDLADLDRDREQRVGVSFFVSKPQNTSRTAAHNPNVLPTGPLAVFDAPAPGQRIAALSRAEVFFMRPADRADGRRELPSLYSPYWQARLVAPTAADRAWAAVQQRNLTLGP